MTSIRLPSPYGGRPQEGEKLRRTTHLATLSSVLVALSLWSAPSALARTSATGNEDPSAPLVIEPDPAVDPLTLPVREDDLAAVELDRDKLVTEVTIGDLAKDPRCSIDPRFYLRIKRWPGGAPFGPGGPEYVADSAPTQVTGSSPKRVTFRFSSPVRLQAGQSYTFQQGAASYGQGCDTLLQTTWPHNRLQVNGGSSPCVDRSPFEKRLWHVQGANDVDLRCFNGVAPQAYQWEASMPTGWLVVDSGGSYQRVVVHTRPYQSYQPPECSMFWAQDGTVWGAREVWWRDHPDYWPRNDYVCTFSQFAPLGQRVEDGWYYGLPWRRERNAAPRDVYLRLDTGKKYVALGDSFSSGVGAGDYEAGPNPDCRRSPHAYARRLFEAGSVGEHLDFVACQGTRINSLRSQPLEGGPQLEHLGPDTGVATVGIGGNDLGFSDILYDCVTVQQLPYHSCRDAHDAEVTDALRRIGGPEGPDSLRQLYREIRAKAPEASVRAVGYPRFFPFEGAGSSIIGEESCEGIRVSDQLWVNAKIRELDNLIRDSSAAEGLEPADLYDASDGHELCHEGDGEDFLNKVNLLDRDESFHPTRYGQGVMADRIRGASASTGGATYAVHPGETMNANREVERESPGAAFSTEWPGSDVEMSLRSPSGRIIDRSTSADDVHHTLAGTREHYYVRDPEPGIWTVHLYGADVDASGEETVLRFHEEPRPNREPIARISQTRTDEGAVSLDASASEDPDGELVDYLWDFGDGELATGEQATHTFTGPGTYRVTLVVEDDREGLGFATASQDVVIEPEDPEPPADEFRFLSPTQARPALNEAKPGKKVRVRFGLGSDGRLDLGSPRAQAIDCASGEQLAEVEEARGKLRPREPDEGNEDQDSQDADSSFVFKWKTEKGWAGECRRLIFRLKNGHEHAADFRFSAKGERDEASGRDDEHEDEDDGPAERGDDGDPQHDATPEPDDDEAGALGSSDKDDERRANKRGEKLTSAPAVRRDVSVGSKQLARWAPPRVACSLFWLLGADADTCPGAG